MLCCSTFCRTFPGGKVCPLPSIPILFFTCICVCFIICVCMCACAFFSESTVITGLSYSQSHKFPWRDGGQWPRAGAWSQKFLFEPGSPHLVALWGFSSSTFSFLLYPTALSSCFTFSRFRVFLYSPRALPPSWLWLFWVKLIALSSFYFCLRRDD